MHYEGNCPQCNQAVTPTRCLQYNNVRRDVLECPNCKARLLKCLTPGCKDYALGGRFWDNAFCVKHAPIPRYATASGLGIVAGFGAALFLVVKSLEALGDYDY